jgi:hypothetical protein
LPGGANGAMAPPLNENSIERGGHGPPSKPSYIKIKIHNILLIKYRILKYK